MAAELVGGAFLSAFLGALMDRVASQEVVDFFKGRRRNDLLLKKLDATLNSVNGLLDDAEKKQITRVAVKKWLDDIKDVVYEADDALEKVAYEALLSKVESKKQKVRNFVLSHNLFTRRIETKLEDILERLEHVVKQKDTLGLIEGVGEKPSSQKIPSTSLVIESDVCGRQEDKKAIIDVLLSCNNDLDVISIVGMGGIGKTTLAQLVFNDSFVQEQFELKGWVCVSEEFDVFKLTKAIIEEINGGRIPENLTSLNQLQLELRKELEKKKFLLVLDDVWNENQAVWESLETALKHGAKGSKIVVTTRNEHVALALHTAVIYRLKELPADECWSLFEKRAFRDGNSSAHPDLEGIGRKIVDKCKGLPLAAKTLGGLLYSKTDVKEWENVLTSNLWNLSNDNIFPALRLSYHYLPSYLKHCFAYCGMFPKDYVFQKEELVLLWMAEGFLIQPEAKREQEEIGNEYFFELVSRSLFQQSSHSQSSFVMHDLIHDLAKLVSGEFCFRLEDEDSRKIPKTIRHLSVLGGAKKFQDIYIDQPLRTLFMQYQWSHVAMNDESLHDLLSSIKHIRVLNVSSYSSVTRLPKIIGNLKHLRYLNLSGSSITRLPDTVGNLYNLQTLILSKCPLVELPFNISNLINLCYFDIRDTKVQEMPPKMGNLTKLQKLNYFNLGRHGDIEELGKLQHLCELSVSNLQNVVDVQSASKANFKGKNRLRRLELIWTNKLEENSDYAIEILGQLQPHANLEQLVICGYGGTRFPHWVGDSSFSNLASLKLSRCTKCSYMPPLGQLSSLEELSITEFDEILYIGPEFYGSCSTRKPFGSLKTLVFERMQQWLEWEDVAGAFPLLQSLHITNCHNLKAALPSHLPSLKTLVITGCVRLEFALPKARTIYELQLCDAGNYVTLHKSSFGSYRLVVGRYNNSVHSLLGGVVQMDSTGIGQVVITNFSSFKGFPFNLFPRLKILEVSLCPNLAFISSPEAISSSSISFPVHESSHFPLLEVLHINGCPKLSLPSLSRARAICSFSITESSHDFVLDKLPSGLYRFQVNRFNASEEFNIGLMLMGVDFTTLEEIIMTNCDPLRFFPLELFSNLKKLVISRCLNFKFLSASSAITEELTSLNSLEIKECPNFVSFPGGGFPVPNLTRLLLWGCSSLKLMPECMHSLLISLEDLRIHYCPQLELFPEGGLPMKLVSLEIQGGNKILSITSIRASNYGKDAEFFPGENLMLPTSLMHLRISNFYHLKSIKLGGLQHLTDLSIQNCPSLQYMKEWTHSMLRCLNRLKIVNCPQLELFMDGDFPLNLESLEICHCYNVIARLMQCDLHLLPSLKHFTISGFDGVEFLSEEVLLPSSITSLHISKLENLTPLKLQHLTSLEELEIYSCRRLEDIPGEQLPSSLFSLIVHDCPLLTKMLEDEKGWQRISHIPYIITDD